MPRIATPDYLLTPRCPRPGCHVRYSPVADLCPNCGRILPAHPVPPEEK